MQNNAWLNVFAASSKTCEYWRCNVTAATVRCASWVSTYMLTLCNQLQRTTFHQLDYSSHTALHNWKWSLTSVEIIRCRASWHSITVPSTHCQLAHVRKVLSRLQLKSWCVYFRKHRVHYTPRRHLEVARILYRIYNPSHFIHIKYDED